MSKTQNSSLVNVGLWKNAPFKYAVATCVEKLNDFLAKTNLPLRYNIDYLNPKELSHNCPDILFLDGGEDVNPAMYGEINRYSHFSPARDAAETTLLEWFVFHKKRISGVCRGHQLINVFFGGSLFQDIRLDFKDLINRTICHPSPHRVSVTDWCKRRASSSSLTRFIGENRFDVSSMHHQAIRGLAHPLRGTLLWINEINEKRYDPLIEGIESKCGKYRGVQSHPEFRGHNKDGLLFSYLMHIDHFITPFLEEVDSEHLESLLSGTIEKKENTKYSTASNNDDRSPRFSSNEGYRITSTPRPTRLPEPLLMRQGEGVIEQTEGIIERIIEDHDDSED